MSGTVSFSLSGLSPLKCGQTGWLYAVDNELNQIAVEADTATVIVGSLSSGSHKFFLKAVGQDGITGSSVKTFTIS